MGQPLQVGVVDRTQVRLDLHAVLLADVVAGERLHGSLELAHAKDAGLNAQFLQSLFHERYALVESVELHQAFGEQVQLVGHGSQVVARFGEEIGVGHDELARRFEVDQFLTNFFVSRPSGRGHAGDQVDAFDIIVVFGRLNSPAQLYQTDHPRVIVAGQR